MDFSHTIAIILLAPVAGLTLLRSCSAISHIYRHQIQGWSRLHIAYPRLFSKPFLFNPTRADTLFYLAHWSITGFCNAYCVSDLSDAGHRAGTVALLHLIVLFASPQICLTSQLLGLTLSSSYRLHRALGSMAVAQTLFHSIVLMKQISLTTPVGASTLTVSLSLTLLNLGD